MLALLTVLPLLSFILIDIHVKGRLLTKGFFLKISLHYKLCGTNTTYITIFKIY